MSSAATSMLKPSTMVDSSGLFFTSFYPTKTVFPFVSFPSKISSFHFSCCHSSAFSPPLSLKNKTPVSSFLTFVAQTSDWAQQEGKTITQDADADADEAIKWENEELNDPESRISDWEAEGEDSIIEGSETEGESGEGGVFEDREVDEEPYAEPPEDAKIFVGNLPYDVDSEKLALIFEKAGIVEIAEVIYNRESDRSRGFGFVTMSSVEEADKAVEMFNRYDLEGRLLTVNKAAPRGERIERPLRTFDRSFRVYVGNLPWDVDGARLQKVFSEHGNVVDARVVYDRETGRSRGFGFVVMSDESGMNDAIDALDGQSLEGRSIRVSVAEERPRRSF